VEGGDGGEGQQVRCAAGVVEGTHRHSRIVRGGACRADSEHVVRVVSGAGKCILYVSKLHDDSKVIVDSPWLVCGRREGALDSISKLDSTHLCHRIRVGKALPRREGKCHCKGGGDVVALE
jgi:hypothetical protein